jgi:DNA-binding protein
MSSLSREPNTVFIGRKPPMNYVLAVITLFSAGNKEVTLKARGQAITTAIDAAEITRRRFMQGLKVNKINLGTDEVQMQEGGTKNVSTIEITLTKEAKPKEEAKATQKAKESA